LEPILLDSLIQFPAFKTSPFRRYFGFGIAAIEDIVHDRENPSDIFISGDEPDDQPMGEGPGMAPGTDLHADATVGPGFGPVSKTGLIV
jgi:hypothetical protein